MSSASKHCHTFANTSILFQHCLGLPAYFYTSFLLLELVLACSNFSWYLHTCFGFGLWRHFPSCIIVQSISDFDKTCHLAPGVLFSTFQTLQTHFPTSSNRFLTFPSMTNVGQKKKHILWRRQHTLPNVSTHFHKLTSFSKHFRLFLHSCKRIRDSFQTSIFPDFSKSVQIFLNFFTCCYPCPSSYKFLRWTVIQRFPDIFKLFRFFPPTCPTNWKYETKSTVVCFLHLFKLLKNIQDVFKFMPYFPDFVRHS